MTTVSTNHIAPCTRAQTHKWLANGLWRPLVAGCIYGTEHAVGVDIVLDLKSCWLQASSILTTSIENARDARYQRPLVA